MVVVFSLDGQEFTAVTRMLSDPDPAKRNRVMDAMLKMKKPVMAEFERAFAG